MKKTMLITLMLLFALVASVYSAQPQVITLTVPPSATPHSVTKFASTAPGNLEYIIFDSVPTCANGVTILVTDGTNTVTYMSAPTLALLKSNGIFGSGLAKIPFNFENNVYTPVGSPQYGSYDCITKSVTNLNMVITADSEVNSFCVRFVIGNK